MVILYHPSIVVLTPDLNPTAVDVNLHPIHEQIFCYIIVILIVMRLRFVRQSATIVSDFNSITTLIHTIDWNFML